MNSGIQQPQRFNGHLPGVLAEPSMAGHASLSMSNIGASQHHLVSSMVEAGMADLEGNSRYPMPVPGGFPLASQAFLTPPIPPPQSSRALKIIDPKTRQQITVMSQEEQVCPSRQTLIFCAR